MEHLKEQINAAYTSDYMQGAASYGFAAKSLSSLQFFKYQNVFSKDNLSDKRLVLFGFSHIARDIIDNIGDTVFLICDNDEALWNSQYKGIRIISPDELSTYQDITVFIEYTELGEELIGTWKLSEGDGSDFLLIREDGSVAEFDAEDKDCIKTYSRGSSDYFVYVENLEAKICENMGYRLRTLYTYDGKGTIVKTSYDGSIESKHKKLSDSEERFAEECRKAQN